VKLKVYPATRDSTNLLPTEIFVSMWEGSQKYNMYDI